MACCVSEGRELSRRGPLHKRDRELRRMPLRMVYRVMRHNALRLVIVLAARVQVPVEAREIAARHLEPDSMARLEVIARRHRLKPDLVYLARFHPHQGFVVPVTIAEPRNG